MRSPRRRKQITIKNRVAVVVAGGALLLIIFAAFWYMWPANAVGDYKYVTAIAGLSGDIGEPFGIAVRGNEIFVSDGQNDKIWRINGSEISAYSEGLTTPSGMAFDKGGNLLFADTGSHTIRTVDPRGEVTMLAGFPSTSGFVDGNGADARFNGPIGIACGPDGKIFVADTYNDRIRVIENGKVSTLAGSMTGYADGIGTAAKFDTPTGLAIWQDKLLVADSGNRRIRVVERDGTVWTLAGNGDGDLKDGLLPMSSFVQPTGLTVDSNGVIFVADGNSIRRIGGTTLPVVTTISSDSRGDTNGSAFRSSFNRPSGLAMAANGDLMVADSENQLVRGFSTRKPATDDPKRLERRKRETAEEFRNAAPARWPYDPPTTKRDIAGTLGEIRGLVKPDDDNIWFHNGLDIAGNYGETARFIRDETVLRPIAVENFGTLRELIRMPTLGYIHIRLSRDQASTPFGDPRFQFQRENGKITGVRVPRGTKFKAGDPIGTLNPMNHVHLIAGRSGSEMNALDALILPGISDARPPVIEKVSLYDQKWNLVETVSPASRIKLTEKTRIVVRAYDQMDGNSERRRLGVYMLGYEILKSDKTPLAEPKWTIRFDRMPSNSVVRLAYANGSHSGATGETIFNYIVTNFVSGGENREDLFDPATIGAGQFVLRVFAKDYFGNESSKDIDIEVLR
ncbi:MAG: SMP-30/gluconolactonase/LRE family protein [Pyrinomonadaceae bacterium]|nr:SMP-30/gluconolactonase/LRE family protein [Pyrinomonadaceae bacterium]